MCCVPVLTKRANVTGVKVLGPHNLKKLTCVLKVSPLCYIQLPVMFEVLPGDLTHLCFPLFSSQWIHLIMTLAPEKNYSWVIEMRVLSH